MSVENRHGYFSDSEKRFALQEGIRCRIAIALVVATENAIKSVGCMFVHYRDLRRLSQNDEKALYILSYAAANVIRGKRNLQEIRFNLFRTEKELEALHEVHKEIVGTKGNVGRIQQVVIEKALSITGAEMGAFFEYNEWLARFEAVATQPKGLQVPSQTIDKRIVGDAARQETLQVVGDVLSPEWQDIFVPVVPNTSSVLALPIRNEMAEGRKIVAMIYLEHSMPEFFKQEHADLLRVLAEQALTGMYYGGLLESNRKTIRALEALGMIAVRAQRPSYDQDTIMRLFLTGVTAEEGLGFSRAMLFLKNKEGDALKGAVAIGEVERTKADERWKELTNNRDVLKKLGKNVLETYLDRAEKLSAAIKDGAAEDAPLSQAIKKHTQPLKSYGRAVADCLQWRRCRVVRYNEDDQFREVLATISDGSDRGAAFVCVPVRSGIESSA